MNNQRRPVVLCILDGWGYREATSDNAIALARTPVYDRLWAQEPHALLQTSGLAVGLPDGQMGNSEVGHQNIGAGRVVVQDLPRIDAAVADEVHDDTILFQKADRLGRPDRDRATVCDNAVRTEHTDREVGDMHRPALAIAGAAHTSEQFEHHRARICTLRDGMTVTTMIAGQQIVVAQIRTDANRNGFLADVLMHRAAHLAGVKRLARRLLEGADHQHLPEHLDDTRRLIGQIAGHRHSPSTRCRCTFTGTRFEEYHPLSPAR